MAISLGGVTLPELVWDNEFGRAPVESKVDVSLGGTPLIWEQTTEGISIDLVGGTETGWATRSVLVALMALASLPEATYALSYEGDTYTVRFRHEEAPVIEANPVVPRPNHAGGDWYNNIRIKLMEV